MTQTGSNAVTVFTHSIPAKELALIRKVAVYNGIADNNSAAVRWAIIRCARALERRSEDMKLEFPPNEETG